ncbi:MAG: hypothetical protein A3C15_00030 [Candidatus Magasanikbacteria bacterium RIFCSPHIGHO2_02_FULL_50_9b]|uniref:Lipoprotein n=1 Tax=Candidatus Magasanikbacteria bacterium RIFCSPHIGHO2_02_FULL_50_9b TaxID=1798682 RepID=A0A1F6M6Y8_9BACT|nr:MAG: hypothetical protein A3C15_00030 [Candidatus Magasanikbacteria bacterium RIFCSPHIGHO2_02_FULL_50_9b]
MKSKIFLVTLGIFALVGAGCERPAARLNEKTQAGAGAQNKSAGAELITRESIKLSEAELFLRSRDDVAPGQAEVTNQTLFAKTTDGQIVEIVADVHTALKGELKPDEYLVQQKNTPPTSRYTYFTASGGGALKPTGFFAFDKEQKVFDQAVTVARIANTNALIPPQLSSDGRRVALFIQAEIEQKKSATVVYFGDLVTGAVSHRYVLADTHKLSYPSTKWISTTEFKVGLEKADEGDDDTISGKPFDVVNIDVRTVPSALAASANYAWDAVVGALFGMQEDGYEIAAVPFWSIVDEIQDIFETTPFPTLIAHKVNGVNADSPYVFLTGPVGMGDEYLIAVYDKTAHQYLKEPQVPESFRKSSPDSWAVSPEGDRIAVMTPQSLASTSAEKVVLIDLMKLNGEKTVMIATEIEPPQTLVARFVYVGGTDASGREYGKGAWLTNNKFSFEVFTAGKPRPVAGTKQTEIKNKRVKTGVLEFKD